MPAQAISLREAFEPVAREAAARYKVDPDIFVRMINQESGWNPQAKSPAGALGIAQFMPGTAKGYKIDPLDPVQALDAAAKYISNGLIHYKGDYAKALAAYNAGFGNVDKYGGVPPFKETRNYVKTILGGAAPSMPASGKAASVPAPFTIPGPAPSLAPAPIPAAEMANVQNPLAIINQPINTSVAAPAIDPAMAKQIALRSVQLPTPAQPQATALPEAYQPLALNDLFASMPQAPPKQPGFDLMGLFSGAGQAIGNTAKAAYDGLQKEAEFQSGLSVLDRLNPMNSAPVRVLGGAAEETARLINGIGQLPADIGNLITGKDQYQGAIPKIPLGDLERFNQQAPVTSFIGKALPYALGEGALVRGAEALPATAKVLQAATATAGRRIASGTAVNAAESFLADPGQGGIGQRAQDAALGGVLGGVIHGGVEGAGKLLKGIEVAKDTRNYNDYLKRVEPLNSLRPATSNEVINVGQFDPGPVKVSANGQQLNRFGVVDPEQVNHPGGVAVEYASRKEASDAYNALRAERVARGETLVGDIKQTPGGAFVINERVKPGAVSQPGTSAQPVEPTGPVDIARNLEEAFGLHHQTQDQNLAASSEFGMIRHGLDYLTTHPETMGESGLDFLDSLGVRVRQDKTVGDGLHYRFKVGGKSYLVSPSVDLAGLRSTLGNDTLANMVKNRGGIAAVKDYIDRAMSRAPEVNEHGSWLGDPDAYNNYANAAGQFDDLSGSQAAVRQAETHALETAAAIRKIQEAKSLDEVWNAADEAYSKIPDGADYAPQLHQHVLQAMDQASARLEAGKSVDVPVEAAASKPTIETKVTPEQQTLIDDGKAMTPEMAAHDATVTEQKIGQAVQDGRAIQTNDGAEVFVGKSPDKTQAAIAEAAQGADGAEGGRLRLVGYQEARQLVQEYLPDKQPYFDAFWQAGAEGRQLVTNYQERVRGWAKLGSVDEYMGRFADGKAPGVEDFATKEQAAMAAEAHRRINPTHQVSDPYPIDVTVRGKQKTKWRVDAVGDRQIDPFAVGVIDRKGEPYLYLMSYNYGTTKKGNVRGYRLGRMNDTVEGFDASGIGANSPYGNTIQVIQRKANEARQMIIDRLPMKQGLSIIADVDAGNHAAAAEKLKRATKNMPVEEFEKLRDQLEAFCKL